MKKAYWVMVGITGIFICLIIGIFVERNLTDGFVVLDQVLPASAQETTSATQIADGKVDLNTATKEQLLLLPGIGEATAQKIIDYRIQHGDFTSIDMLINVNGIGEKKLDQLRPYIKVTSD